MRHLIGKTWLKVFGWRMIGLTELPRQFVFVAAPHTSNWDFPFMVAAAWTLRIELRWLGKHTLFQGPFGWFFRMMGGIPVDRRAAHGLVAEVARRFDEEAELCLAVPPEGTRGKVEYWKSGFYHIARAAHVPIGLSSLDFGKRECGIGMMIDPTGDVAADMKIIRGYYAGILGRHPHLQCVPRLREEDAPAAEQKLAM